MTNQTCFYTFDIVERYIPSYAKYAGLGLILLLILYYYFAFRSFNKINKIEAKVDLILLNKGGKL